MFGKKKNKKTFFEKITGAVQMDDQMYEHEDPYTIEENEQPAHNNYKATNLSHELDDQDGELAVDVINADDAIIIRAIVAGVRPGEVDIDISRDMVTIRASREEEYEATEDNYFQRELYWGSFSRNILLPEEIDVDLAEAKEKHGLLVIKLPKVDKHKKTKLQVKG